MSLSGFQSPGGCVLLTVVLDQRGRGCVIFVGRYSEEEGIRRGEEKGWSSWMEQVACRRRRSKLCSGRGLVALER